MAQPAGAQACANCHGSRGEGGLTGAPPLAGLPQAYLARQLAAYYAGLRASPTPPQVGSLLWKEHLQSCLKRTG